MSSNIFTYYTEFHRYPRIDFLAISIVLSRTSAHFGFHFFEHINMDQHGNHWKFEIRGFGSDDLRFWDYEMIKNNLSRAAEVMRAAFQVWADKVFLQIDLYAMKIAGTSSRGGSLHLRHDQEPQTTRHLPDRRDQRPQGNHRVRGPGGERRTGGNREAAFCTRRIF